MMVFHLNGVCPFDSFFLPFFPIFPMSVLSFDFLSIGAMRWADLVPDCDSACDSAVCEPIEVVEGPCDEPRDFDCLSSTSSSTFTDEALEGWCPPDLTLRKALWENFPVNVLPVASNDGGERYALTWNMEKFHAWRVERTETFWEGMEYEAYCIERLFHAIEMNRDKYILENPRNSTQICVIAMVSSDKPKTEVKEQKTELVRLNDVKAQFPVVWKQVNGVYQLEFHRANLRTRLSKGEKECEVRAKLLEALGRSASWKIRPATGFLCELILC